jgi:hypothetical protein
MNIIHPVIQVIFEKIGILHMDPYYPYHYCPEDRTHAVSFRWMIPRSYWHLIKIITAVLKNVQLCFWRPKGRALIFGTKMFVFNEHRHVMDGLLNTEYGYCTPNCFQCQQCTQTDGIPKTAFLFTQGAWKHVNSSKSQDRYFTIIILSNIYYV